MIVILVICQTIVLVSCKSVYLSNVDCAPYVDYVKTDALDSFSYTPYFVKLFRCHGANIIPNIRRKQCVPTDDGIKDVSAYVFNYNNVSYHTVTFKNHTACYQKCAITKSDCSPYQSFSEPDCACKCNYQSAPKPDPCIEPFYWDQTGCNCACLLETLKCEKRKEFSKEMCGCVCKQKFHLRCSKQKKVLDDLTCQCVDPTVVTGASASNCRGTIKVGMLILVMVLEAVTIVILYFIFYVFCYKKRCLQKEAENSKTEDTGNPGDTAYEIAVEENIPLDTYSPVKVNNNNDNKQESIGGYLSDDSGSFYSKDEKSLISSSEYDDCFNEEPGVGYVSCDGDNYRNISLV